MMVQPAVEQPNRPGKYERTPEHRLLMRWRKLGCKPPQLNPNWRGGQHYYRGYVWVYQSNHPHAHRNYVKRAILVLEEKLGRYLLPGMEPHHKNEIRDDDRPENLEELTHGEHTSLHQKRR